jgi:CheY-like chemotaxis protein
MARKRALVVDDSKSARVILSRMLEKYDVEVDMAESAEQAIEYLNGNRPDAIFMDHLMPGMDGLQAVKAIKSNALTATIPIMMYTSQEGELYVGQARALGAMGVLPKQVRPVDVSKVLYELHLLPDRRDTAEPALAPVEIDGSIRGGGVVGPAAGRPSPTGAGIADARPPSADWGRRMEAAVKEQSADIRRFIVASLDSFASRTSTAAGCRSAAQGLALGRSAACGLGDCGHMRGVVDLEPRRVGKSSRRECGTGSGKCGSAALESGTGDDGQRSDGRLGGEHGADRLDGAAGRDRGVAARAGSLRRDTVRSKPPRGSSRVSGETHITGISRCREDHQRIRAVLSHRQFNRRFRAGERNIARR